MISALKSRRLKVTVFSFTILAAPAANECGPGPVPTGEIPCNVAKVLHDKCQSCHSATPRYGAPMPLVTLADLHAPAPSDASKKVWERVDVRIDHGQSPLNPMPPASQPDLDATERQVLEGWLGQGAPGVDNNPDCPPLDNLPIEPAGPQYLPCTPTHTIKAHQSGSSNEYSVPAGTRDQYVCFAFANPFAAGELATAWAPTIDDERVIHHWILYGMSSLPSGVSVGGHTSPSNPGPCYLATLNGTMLTGWAPGGRNSVMESDVGVNMQYPYYLLQVHYNNFGTGATNTTDSSGVSFCTNRNPSTGQLTTKPNVAGVVTLGNSSFTIPAGATAYDVTGNCTNLSTDGSEITIIGTSPHMHRLGTRFRTRHSRGGVDLGDLSNVTRWQFENQINYPTLPRRAYRNGDTLTTTCTFQNPSGSPVGYGPGTDAEMCYDFILAYPYSKAKKKCGPTI
jgi:hypothetical protein